MNLDELKNQLTDYNSKLDDSIRLNTRLLREARLQRTGSTLHRLSRSILIELVINVVGVALLGMFIADHVGAPRFVAPAVALDLCALFLIVSGGYQLAALRKIDYSAPILVIQKKLGTLRALRVRIVRWVLTLSPLAWTPLLIVTLEGVFGVDVYAAVDTAWLVWNLLLGVAVIPLAVWASKRYAGRMQRSPVVHRLMNSIAGHDLSAALAFLDTLARLEQEDAGA